MVYHREKALAGAVELLDLLQQPRALLVQPRVLDGGRGLRGEQHHDVLVVLGEVAPTQLLGEIEIAEHPSPADDGGAEERVHRRMVRGEAVGVGMAGEVGQPDDPRLSDHEAEDAMPAGGRTDARALLRRDAVGGEALE